MPADTEYQAFLAWKASQANTGANVTGIPSLETERPPVTFVDVLKNLVNRARFTSESDVHAAHAAIDAWWDNQSASHDVPDTVTLGEPVPSDDPETADNDV